MKKRQCNPVFCKVIFSVFCLLLVVAQPGYSQALSNENVQSIVQKLATSLADQYPFPEISAKYSAALLSNLKSGQYNNYSEAALASRLTADLAKVHKDVHLTVFQNEGVYKSLTGTHNNEEAAAAGPDREAEQYRRINYGIRSVELDPLTSTAYINFPGPFLARQEAFDAAAAAMNVAANSKYVIIDVRQNGGGSGVMGRFLASYFYDAGDEQFYLNGFHKDRTKDVQEWTYAFVPGKRNPTAKVYILVGKGTASAAEGFAYALQKLQRATIVGDSTAGAGIAGSYAPLGNNLVVFLPVKMVVAPHSNTGWEGAGVIPDAYTGNKDALTEARQLIMKEMLQAPASPEEREIVEWLIDENNVAKRPAADVKTRYAGLARKYNNNLSITYVNDTFTWVRSEPGKAIQSFTLKEIKPDVFTIVGLNKDHGESSSRVYIVRNASGQIESLTRKTLLKNGTLYTAVKAFLPQ
ncbi:S41 family peptidase [Paraflavitalea pollutisoli]|uniref:S41 family peptidase n=1 Tax=Paraflavitalea pollutisoli TaxID=3034143 RepID=UPI0023EAB08B|nr:S41 family peptidase [Paraflavitalea sp. H1-2-19X]